MAPVRRLIPVIVAAFGAFTQGSRAAAEDTQARISRDVTAGRPIILHVVVALCDNVNQGIVPVPKHLGNGQDPQTNLYWGARYGVKTFLTRDGGWRSLPVAPPGDRRIRERIVLTRTLEREGRQVPVYVIADAWDGAEIRAAIERFLIIAAGGPAESVRAGRDQESVTLAAGGSAHVAAFIGHNGLMDFDVSPPAAFPGRPAGSAIVLACASKPYFLEMLQTARARPVILTTGLMAPEAYSLEAAIRSLVAAETAQQTRDAAAAAYDRYQHCGVRAAKALFWSDSP